ncbi:MAG: hypothetical protein QGH90_06625 [Candidatus Poseidoniaceae archaeon]|jgi:hypothetical protein|nr:hypothetical protein [Candidatus Poseidoniaceae archaeon]MDP7001561.1 hypothetical protein [Candidatus Poseidoniaceae archaeon]
MRKALAQNPNILRTLVGLSLTLIIVLSYAVYSASLDSDYYVYSNTSSESIADLELISKQQYTAEGEQWTMWIWEFDSIGTNLTWINATLSGGIEGGIVKMTNAGEGYWSHPDLGNIDGEKFSCAISCAKLGTHQIEIDSDGSAQISGLTDWQPARRDGGTVRATNISVAEYEARELVDYNHSSNVWQVSLNMPGNHSLSPEIEVTFVNEMFGGIEAFSIDPATELLWATFSVIGCFAVLLVPSFAIYFAAQAKERRAEKIVLLNGEEE